MTKSWALSGTEVSALVRDRKLSVTEVVDEHLARIDAVNGDVNAIVLRTDDDARSRARKLEEGTAELPLGGAVLTTKINTDHVPYPTDNGIKALRDAVPAATHASVTGLIDSGMVMVGRTNSPAFAMRGHTDNELHGETLNPHRPDISCGGSSGGAGVAVATGMCHIAQGNDVAGSVRWPAYLNGVLGLRPTIGRMPTGGSSPIPRGWTASMMSTHGPLARTMDDLRAGYEAMCVSNWKDPFWVPATTSFGHVGTKRVALVVEDESFIDPVIVATIRKVGALLEDAGYDVVETAPPMLDIFFSLWRRLSVFDIRLGLIPMLPQIDDAGLKSVISAWVQTFPEATPETYMKALFDRDMLLRAWNQFFDEYPLVVTPMLTIPTLERGYDVRYPDAGDRFNDFGRWGINLSAIGIPALAFPVGSHDGAPLGVQLMSHAWREDHLFDAGRALEDRLGVVGPIDPKS